MKVDAAIETLLPGERTDRITWTKTRQGFHLELVAFDRRFMVSGKTRSYGHPDEDEHRGNVPDD